MSATLEILDDDEPTVTDAEGEVSYEKIYDWLLINEDIILVINKEDEEDLRRGLSVVKYAHTNKLKSKGQPTDNRQIGYQHLAPTPEMIEDQLRIQIFLKARKSLTVHRLIVTDKSL